MASGPVMKIFNWILRIIGLGIVLGVFGWLIYDIFFQGEEVKARVLIGSSFLSIIPISPGTKTVKDVRFKNNR